MRIKILSTPKQSTIPENRINPFSVPDTYKYGGTKQNMGSQNGVPLRTIDTYSDYLRQPSTGNTMQSPYHATGKQLPDVPKNEADIVVEKDEQIMGDFNGDGMPVLMGVNTGSHESGNDQGVNVPDGSFVFSDTKSLKIKDPQILEMFGMKKAATPAQMAKQYDLQKYKKILDDPNRDAVDKNTAKIMYENYTNKLNTLASIQEATKKQQDERRQQSEHMRYGGYAPQYAGGGYGPTHPYYGYNSVAENQQDMVEQKPQAAWFANTMGTPAAGNLVDDQQGYRTQFLNAAQNAPDMENTSIASLPMTGQQSPTPQIPTLSNAPSLPLTAVIKNEKERSKDRRMRNPFVNPDTLAAAVTGLRAEQYPAYNPIRQVAHGAVGQPVYLDPTRAKAAVQEAANSASNAIAMGATGPVSRANTLALYGKTAPQVANIEAEYAQKNAEIGTRSNEQAAQTYNQLWQQQQNYNKEYVEDTHNAQMDKLGYQFGVQNELLKQAYQAENRKRTVQNYNYINPYYTMNSRGYIYPKGEEQMNALNSITGTNPGSSKGYNPFDHAEAAIKTGHITDPDIIKAMRQRAGLAYMQELQGPKMSQTYNPNTGTSGNVHYSGYDYDGDGTLKKRGGKIKKTKVRITAIPSK